MKNARAKRAILHFSDMQIYDVFIAVVVVVAKDQNGKQIIITLSPPYSHSVNEQSTYNPGKYKLLGRPFKLLKKMRKTSELILKFHFSPFNSCHYSWVWRQTLLCLPLPTNEAKGQYNGKWPIRLVYMPKSLMTHWNVSYYTY